MPYRIAVSINCGLATAAAAGEEREVEGGGKMMSVGPSSLGKRSLTVMMVCEAVEELEKLRERVPLPMLLSHFKRRHPVDRDTEMLKRELIEQCESAVKLGLLRKFSDGTYSISTIRWQATVDEFGYC